MTKLERNVILSIVAVTVVSLLLYVQSDSVLDAQTNSAPTIHTSGYPTNVTTGQRRTIQATAIDADGNLTGWRWYLDGVKQKEHTFSPSRRVKRVVTYTFTTAGTYTFKLEFFDEGGLTVSFTATVTVTDPPQVPTVSRVSPTRAYIELEPGDSQTFRVRATDPDSNISQWEWFVNDVSRGGQSLSLTGDITREFSLTFSVADSYTVDVEFTDREQNSDSVTWTVVANTDPTVRRVSPSSRSVTLTKGSAQTFSARATDDDDNISEWEWFVDDESQGGQSLSLTGDITKQFSYTFSSAGDFTVEVEFTDELLESDSVSWSVEVTEPTATTTVNVTVGTSPSGLTVTVDGTDRTAPYTATWDSGTSHTLNVPSPQNIAGVSSRYAYSSWSQGGSQSQTVSPTSDATYTANFTQQHFLSTRTEPNGIGIAGGGTWYDHGATATVGPAPSIDGYEFSYWRKGGSNIGTDPASVSVTVDGPFLVEAVYTASDPVEPPATTTVSVTVGTSPSGRTVTVDGTDHTAPYIATWDSGTYHTLNVPSPQNITGVSSRYVYSGWSHGGSQSRQTVSPTSDATYTANFTQQHFLSTRTEPRGIGIAGGGQWYDHGATATVGPAPSIDGYEFSYWRKGGSNIGTDPASVSVTVDGPFLVEAVYTVSDPPDPVTVRFWATYLLVREGTGEVDLTVAISSSPAETVTVNLDFDSPDDTATYGRDYQPTATKVTFEGGTTSLRQKIPVKIVDSVEVELLELFRVELQRASDTPGFVTISEDRNVVGVEIHDDDLATLGFDPDEIVVNEGDSFEIGVEVLAPDSTCPIQFPFDARISYTDTDGALSSGSTIPSSLGFKNCQVVRADRLQTGHDSGGTEVVFTLGMVTLPDGTEARMMLKDPSTLTVRIIDGDSPPPTNSAPSVIRVSPTSSRVALDCRREPDLHGTGRRTQTATSPRYEWTVNGSGVGNSGTLTATGDVTRAHTHTIPKCGHATR